MDEALPYRQKVYGCIHPETYKYFFEKSLVQGIWMRLREHYGECVENKQFFSMQIDGKFLIFRSVLGGNPVTVIRKRGCAKKHLDEFHALVEFTEMES